MSVRRKNYVRNKIRQVLIDEINNASDLDLFFHVSGSSTLWSKVGRACMNLWVKHIKGE